VSGRHRARRLAVAALAACALAAVRGGAAPGAEDPDGGDRILSVHPERSGAAGDAESKGESARALLERVEALKAVIHDRPKTPEILLALGNLYFQNGRYLDAIDWYRQAVEHAAPALARLDALPRGRGARLSAKAREACDRATAKPTYDALVAAADRARRADASAEEAYCLRQAVLPALDAQARRGNAFLLAGNPDQAVAEESAVLAHDPDHADALFLTGALLAGSAAEDPAKLAGAVDAWRRFLRLHPDDPRAARVREDLTALEVRGVGAALH
jgi:tetratricopeptide (TPR) repeat protein